MTTKSKAKVFRVPSDYVVFHGSVHAVVPAVKSKRGFRFANEQIRLLRNGKIAYLRSKYDVDAGKVTHSIRTQNHGKGVRLASAKPEPIQQAGSALDRLYKRMPFEFVLFVPYMNFEKGTEA